MVNFSVKFYYTQEFAATTEDIDGFLDLVIAETNQGFVNSGINLKVIHFYILHYCCHGKKIILNSFFNFFFSWHLLIFCGPVLLGIQSFQVFIS